MRTTHRGLLALLCFSFITLQGVVFGQSSNKLANEWFQGAVRERDPQKKIKTYLKAIEADPVFVEALYNLGLTYKKVQDYQKAEQYLSRAYMADPNNTPNDLKLKMLFELGNLYRRLGNLRDSEEAFRGSLGLAMNKEMQAQIYFELGRLLYKQNRYKDALVELEKGQKLQSSISGSFTRLIQVVDEMVSLQQLYDEAERSQASGDLQRARSLYEQVHAANNDFRNVRNKLSVVDSLLRLKSDQKSKQLALQQAGNYENDGNFEMAIAIYESMLTSDTSAELRTRLQNARVKLEQKRQEDDLAREYESGLSALKLRNWTSAIYAFEKIMQTNPRYRNVRRKLAQAQNGLESEKIETVVSQYYAQGIDAMSRQEYDKALAALNKVQSISPAYRDVQSLIADVEGLSAMHESEPAPPRVATVDPAQIDSMYNAALNLIDQKAWSDAIAVLEKVRRYDPSYQDIDDLLKTAQANRDKAAGAAPGDAASPAGGSKMLIAGVIFIALVFPVVGAVVFVPTVRAQYYLLRSNHLAAAHIYERLLEKNPGKIKLYLPLADIYLLLGQRDEQAMKVFKMILRLNLTTPKREQIASLVTQNYLTEGKKDEDAISVLENALKAEFNKMNKDGSEE